MVRKCLTAISLKRAISFLLALTLSIRTMGSEENENNFYRSSFHFSFTPMIYQSLRIKHHNVDKYLKSYPLPSGECSVGYALHLNNGYLIDFGVGIGIVPFSIGYSFISPLIHTSFEEEKDHDLLCFDYFQFIANYSISLQKILISHKNPKYSHSFNAGVKLNRLLLYPYSYEIEQTYFNEFQEIPFFSFQLDNNGSKNNISFFVKVGRKRIIKNGNFIQVSLVGNLSPKAIGKGNYRFMYMENENHGVIYQTINYIGVEVNLVFKPFNILNYI